MVPEEGSAQIENEEQYEALREEGMSKEKAARIANTGEKASKKGGKHKKYEKWTRDELYNKARKVGIDGRSKMSKEELIKALRDH